jgi:hypothetical protein
VPSISEVKIKTFRLIIYKGLIYKFSFKLQNTSSPKLLRIQINLNYVIKFFKYKKDVFSCGILNSEQSVHFDVFNFSQDYFSSEEIKSKETEEQNRNSELTSRITTNENYFQNRSENFAQSSHTAQTSTEKSVDTDNRIQNGRFPVFNEEPKAFVAKIKFSETATDHPDVEPDKTEKLNSSVHLPSLNNSVPKQNSGSIDLMDGFEINESSTYHPISTQHQVLSVDTEKSDSVVKYISMDEIVQIETSTNRQASSDDSASTNNPTLPDNLNVSTDKPDSKDEPIKIELSPGHWISASDRETADHFIEIQKKNLQQFKGKKTLHRECLLKL